MINPMNPVRPAAWQEGLQHDGHLYPRADAHSAASYCRNLHLDATGCLQPCTDPKILGFIEGNPIGFDRQPACDTLFSQLDDGTVCIEGHIDPDGEFIKQLTPLHNPEVPVKSMGCSGNLVVMSLTDGTLLYIHRTPEGYRWLGELPQPPQATAQAEISNITGESVIEQYTFSEPVADMRSGTSEKIKTELGKRLLSAYSNALQQLHGIGMWHNPVAVRFAYRLYNGSLLCISAPVPVGLDRGIDYCPVVGLPLIPAFDDNNHQIGYAGTDSATLQLYGYSISVTCPEIPDGWRDIISSIEVYVTEDPEGVDMDKAPLVTHRQIVGTGWVLSLRALRRETAESYRVFTNGIWHRHSVIGGGMLRLLYRDTQAMQRLDMTELSEQSIATGLKARLLLNHDDMLHMANISRYTPLPQPGGYLSDADGNITVEPISVGSDSGLARFSVPQTFITPSANGLTLHAPLLLWHNSEGVGRFRLRLKHDGTVYEAFVQGQTVSNESAWAYLTDGGEGIPFSPTDLPGLSLPHSVGTDYPSMVMTMQRGNPLIAASHTTSAGGHIQGMAPQYVGGGAYTRQYIYLFTHLGITALTHSYNGGHTNCRTISPEHIGNPQRMVCPTSHGVYALTDTGRLMRMRDAKCETLLARLGDNWRDMGWDSNTDELWICGNTESMVLQLNIDMLAHIRTCPITQLLQCGTWLYCMDEYRLCNIYGGSDQCADCCWIGMPEPYQPGERRILQIPLYGEGLNGRITIEQVCPSIKPWESAESLGDTHRAAVIEQLQVRGNLYHPLCVPLHPLSAGGTGRASLMRVTVVHSA